MQEVFVRLWNDPQRFDPGRGTLRAYLLAQTHGRSVDLVRAESAVAPARRATRSAPPSRATTSSARCGT